MSFFSLWINVLFAIIAGEMLMSEGNELCLSETAVTWEVAANYREHMSFSYIREHGWDIMTSLLPEDGDPVWIAARAKYTPYFSFEGYYSDIGERARCPNRVWNGTSIGECQRKCEFSGYFALKGNQCVCMEDKTCLGHWQGSCDKMARCLYNPMDNCGDCSPTKDVYAVYEATFGKEVEVYSGPRKLCAYVIQDATNQQQYRPVKCDTKFIRRYICLSPYNIAVLKDVENAIDWNGARTKCLEEGMNLHSGPGNSSTEHRPYWTSVRRGVDINWVDGHRPQNNVDDHPLCISARISTSRMLELQEENCQKHYRYLYYCGTNETGMNEEKNKDESWYVLPFDFKWLFLIPLLGIPVVIYCYKRKRTTETGRPCPNPSTMQPLSEYITPFQSNVYNRTNDPGEPPRLENVYDELPDPDIEYNGYNTISETGTQRNNIHTSDKSYSVESI